MKRYLREAISVFHFLKETEIATSTKKGFTWIGRSFIPLMVLLIISITITNIPVKTSEASTQIQTITVEEHTVPAELLLSLTDELIAEYSQSIDYHDLRNTEVLDVIKTQVEVRAELSKRHSEVLTVLDALENELNSDRVETVAMTTRAPTNDKPAPLAADGTLFDNISEILL